MVSVSPAVINEALLVSLKHAVEIIEKHVPRDALGINARGDPGVPGGYEEWPLLDEYLHHMKAAIAEADCIANADDKVST